MEAGRLGVHRLQEAVRPLALLAMTVAVLTTGCRATAADRGHSMIDTLAQLGEIMSRDTLTQAAAAAALKEASAAATLGLDGDGNPYLATLRVDKAPDGAALSARFGKPHPAPPLHYDSPRVVLYYPPAAQGRKFTWALLVRTPARGTGPIELVIRRDPRLD